MATGEVDDYSQPILSGEGESDYERYLRTDELLALQKTPEEQAHRDELLFQTVHQASELWLKLAWSEAEEATRLIEQGELQAAQRLLRRSSLALDYVIAQLEMLEALSPWEYQAIRKVLGHGSGFDSPGFRQIRRVTPPLGQAFSEKVREAGLNVVSLYVEGRSQEDLYQLAELLLSWDERIGLWRMRHYLVVARVIGDQVVGTQGTPVELLGGPDQAALLPRALAGAQPVDRAGQRGSVNLRDEVTQLLQELIRLDTVNPPGNETQAAELLRDYLAGHGVESELYARTPERANLVARIPGRGGGKSLLLLSHTDTVPADAEEWEVTPGRARCAAASSGAAARST